jgi:hypothetical protein
MHFLHSERIIEQTLITRKAMASAYIAQYFGQLVQFRTAYVCVHIAVI